ncbi:hypothetical protein EGT42_09275 [Acinetobacter haemolyticus]|nr:hypothetical protein EGT42_09275 [Acinetobacter haemolyticus]
MDQKRLFHVKQPFLFSKLRVIEMRNAQPPKNKTFSLLNSVSINVQLRFVFVYFNTLINYKQLF